MTPARKRRISWKNVPCGSRNSAFDAFKTAIKSHGSAFNILLVDSEGPIAPSESPIQHLRNRDNWIQPGGVQNEQIHLMVEMMEAWFIADIEASKEYYGQGFNQHSIPTRHNVEEISKIEITRALQAATRHTQKGEYAKIRHGTDILKRIRPHVVRSRATHCDRLFVVLDNKIHLE